MNKVKVYYRENRSKEFNADLWTVSGSALVLQVDKEYTVIPMDLIQEVVVVAD